MDAKTLNLIDAFRLASILSKHIDIEKMNPQADPIDFISGIVEKITPEEYLQCVSLLTDTDIDTIKQEIALDILTVFIEGLKQNSIISLLNFTRSLGL